MTDPRTQVKPNVHGYKQKPSRHREIQGLLTAGGVADRHNANGRTHSHTHTSTSGHQASGSSRSHSNRDATTSHNNGTETPRTSSSKMQRQNSQGTKGSSSSDGSTKWDEPEVSKGRTFPGSSDAPKASRRSRTLSPARRLDGTLRGRTLSPVNKKSYFRMVSEELSPRHVKKVIHSFRFSTSKQNDVPFDQKGCCSIHFNVQLAKKDKNGLWRIVQDVCPECNEKSKPPRSRSSSTSQKSGKVSEAIIQLKIADGYDNVTALKADTNNETSHGMSNTTKDVIVSSGAIVLHSAKNAVPAADAPIHKTRKKSNKHLRVIKKTLSNASLTSVTQTPDSVASHPSPAFSCRTSFPALPLISDDLNLSYADTIKHSNALNASKKVARSQS